MVRQLITYLVSTESKIDLLNTMFFCQIIEIYIRKSKISLLECHKAKIN